MTSSNENEKQVLEINDRLNLLQDKMETAHNDFKNITERLKTEVAILRKERFFLLREKALSIKSQNEKGGETNG